MTDCAPSRRSLLTACPVEPMRLLLPLVTFTALSVALDVYVLRAWRRFASPHPRLRWTVTAYRAGLVVAPVLLVLYAVLTATGGADGLRRASAVLWGLWYAPKVPIALVLGVKDLLRLLRWCGRWLRARIAPRGAPPVPPSPAHLPRRAFLQRVGWGAATAPVVLVGYGMFRVLYDFEVRHVRLALPDLPRALDGLRIAQLSDLHAGSFLSERPIHDAVDLLLAERPDLIALTGDFVNNDHREAPTILPALDRLRAPLGVYGVRGNHDHYADVRRVTESLEATPMTVLVNDARTLRIDGARLHVLGTDNTGFGQDFADLPRALAAADPNGEDLFILLAHDPSFWDLGVRPTAPQVALTLSGHTHGGQIGIEWGPLRWGLSRAVYRRWAGLYTEPGPSGAQHLYVNRGLGTVGPPIRLGIRPEITILTLARA